jgi:hypothetical protein
VKKTAHTQFTLWAIPRAPVIAFGAFATNPQLDQKIKINFALASVATV